MKEETIMRRYDDGESRRMIHSSPCLKRREGGKDTAK
jgi:hypothetical protein